MGGSKAVFDVTINGKPKVLYRNTAVLGDFPGEEEVFLKDFKAAMLFDLEEKTTTAHKPHYQKTQSKNSNQSQYFFGTYVKIFESCILG